MSHFLLAQAAEAASGTSKLLEYGVLGLACFLLIGALVWAINNWKKSMEARVSDAQGWGNALKEVNDAGANLVVESNRTNDATKLVLEALKTKIERHDQSQADRVAKVEKSVDDLRTKQNEFIIAANAAAAARGKNG